MRKLDADLDEIAIFLNNNKPSVPNFMDKAIRAKLKSSYKQLHALLVWGLVVDQDPQKDVAVSTFFTECLSDISHAYFLNLSSLYKSSRSSLRSAIENAVRVALLEKAIDVSQISSVFDLFARAKAEYKDDKLAHSLVVRLATIYADLCKSVHSVAQDYLSLSVPFEKLSQFDESEFVRENDRLRDVCSMINQCAFWLWDKKLSRAGYLNEDYVRDAVPRIVKRAKASSPNI